ncbi:MAG TPA: SRPBCC family protein [Solirubrobacteraceae bacterium]|jgi:uncharacterized protein YndB with AHSA1/START domain|nr:SRPBCC family protein [Solirubrobacteraceae bacterium]
MPTARRTRTINASPPEVWEVLGDPHHLPRWWPRVSRVEAVTLTGTGELDAFTEVLTSAKGKIVRADFRLVDAVSEQRIVWSQQVQNTPFARVLKSAETEVSLAGESAGEATEVTIELRQALQGFLARLGGHLVRRAAGSTIEEALDGLERIVGRPG